MPRKKGLERAIDRVPRNRKIAHARGLAAYAVDGQTPEAVVFPNTVEEVSHLLSAADKDGKAVVPWGGGTGMDLGNLAARVDLVIGTSRLNRVVEHEPADLTVIVEGGTTLGAHLEGADLTGATGLTKEQIRLAHTDEKTRLPDYLREEDETQEGPSTSSG